MKSLHFLLVFFLISFSILGQELSSSKKVEKLIKTDVNEGRVVGISAAITVDDKIIWKNSQGFSNKKEKIDFTSNTISRIASITKPMTAIAIMQLVEQNKIQLNDKVSIYLPEFKRKSLEEITIKQVLQHSSGITEYKNKKEATNDKEYATLSDALKIFIDRKLRFEPGTEFGYTSYGYVVLGRIIETVSGLTYETYLKKNIWNIAGMKQTSVENFGVTHTNKAIKYHQSKPLKFQVINKHNLSDRIAAGGVQSTVEDILKFGNAILKNTLITSESFKLMIINSGLKKEGNGYGMGWYLYGKNSKMGTIIGHNGAQLGCSSFLFILPKKNAVVAVLSNTSGAMQEISNIAVALLDLVK